MSLRPVFEYSVRDGKKAVISTQFSPDGKEIAASLQSGSVLLFKAGGDAGYRHTQTLTPDFEKTPLPAMSLRYMKTKAQRLVSAYATGHIRTWHTSSGQMLSEIEVPGEGDNKALMCMDLDATEKHAMASGYDAVLRLYDLETKTVVGVYGDRAGNVSVDGHSQLTGHTNRVFSVKFNPADPSLVASAGWDKTVQLWDVRQDSPTAHLSGPYVAGDGLEFSKNGDELYVAAYHKPDTLHCFDMRTRKLLWTMFDHESPCSLYDCKLAPHEANLLATVGSQSAELRLVHLPTRAVVGAIPSSKGIYSVAWSPSGDRLVYGGESGITVVDMSFASRPATRQQDDSA